MVKVTYSGLKMLETIITADFFSIWVYVHEHSRFTGQQWKGEAICFGGQTFLTKNLWEGYSKWED